MMPSGHKAFVVNNVSDVNLLLMHNKTFAAEYVLSLDWRKIKEADHHSELLIPFPRESVSI